MTPASAGMVRADWASSRRVKVAGAALLVPCAVIVLGGLAGAFSLLFRDGEATGGGNACNSAVPGAAFAQIFGGAALALALAAALPLTLGIGMLRGKLWAAQIAISLGLLAILAGALGWLGWGWGSLALVLLGACVSGLPLSAFTTYSLGRLAFAGKRWLGMARWVCRPVQSVALLVGVAALCVMPGRIEARFGTGGASDDDGPIVFRSDLSLALQCAGRGYSAAHEWSTEECRAFATRAPRAAPAVVRVLQPCAGHIGRGTSGSLQGKACEGDMIGRLFGLLGQQRAEVGLAELERWVKRPDADLWLRAKAARVLAEAGDVRAADATLLLLAEFERGEAGHADRETGDDLREARRKLGRDPGPGSSR